MRRPSIVLLVAAVIVGYLGFREYRYARLAKGETRAMTVADLAAKGPGDATRVQLTDFWLGRAYIYRTAQSGSQWTEAYVPVFPGKPDGKARGQAQFEGEVKVIIKTTQARSREQLYRLDGHPVTGVLVNSLESFSDDEKAVLRGTYPKIDFDRCWIVEVNRQPASPGRIFSMVGGGGALGVVALAMFFMGNRAGTNLLPRR
jgi:hypothetical protein